MDFNGEYGKYLYVIDEDYKIVCTNKTMDTVVANAKGEYCYKVLCEEPGPCEDCPIGKLDHGECLEYCKAFNSMMKMTFSRIELSDSKEYTVVILDKYSEESDIKSISDFDYSEFIELDYENNNYRVLCSIRGGAKSKNQTGKMDDMINNLADNIVHTDDRERLKKFWCIDQIGDKKIPVGMLYRKQSEFRRLMPVGGYVFVNHIIIPGLRTGDAKIMVASIAKGIRKKTYDSEKKRLHERSEFHPLTAGLIARCSDIKMCFVSIDIEKFKIFNEWYGVPAGDAVLSQISEYLNELQQDDKILVGYSGNDDFVVCLPYDEDKIKQIYNDLDGIIKSHCDELRVQPAFGIYIIDDRTEPVAHMISRAKLAASAVVGKFFERIKYFSVDMLQESVSDHMLFAKIQRAFSNQLFTAHFQPKCDMETGEIVGAEALARIEDNVDDKFTPAIFIPFMEKSGIITLLDTWIWEEVCKYQRRMIDKGKKVLPISVNVSKVDFYALDITKYFKNLTKKYNLPVNLIEIEMTENTYIQNFDEIAKVVEDLKAAGFKVLMDDFGSEYSSLKMLKEVNVNVLKTDIGFLKGNIFNENMGFKILEMICSLSNTIGTEIIIEGVETAEQKNSLLKIGCRIAQGYYFYRPMKSDDYENLLEDAENTVKEA